MDSNAGYLEKNLSLLFQPPTSQQFISSSQDLNKDTVVADDDYFATLDPEQIKCYEECGQEATSFSVDSTLNCTSCNKPVQIQVFPLQLFGSNA